jgi:hypothetical protein
MNPMITLYRTRVMGIIHVYDSDLTNINLIVTDIIDVCSASICVLRVLEERHW